MAGYQKYMFDNFVVKNEDVNVFESEEGISPEEIVAIDYSDNVEIEDVVQIETIVEEPQEEIIIEEPQVIENTYSEEELKAAVRTAEETSYEKGYQAALNGETEKQNILLEEIKNQLTTIFALIEQQTVDLEKNSLKFMVGAIRKILPTMEKEKASDEVKKFLTENFTTFASQETLSFSFNPASISAAKILEKLAEQNDFEGKISVHKDENLGLSDCRVEWKNGGIERNVSKVLDQVESLIETNE